MCKDCGCQEGNKDRFHEHEHEHRHEYDHHHTHDGVNYHTHDAQHDNKIRHIEMEMNVLAKNQEYANKNRKWFSELGIVAVNIISSPGSGKTSLLEKTLETLKNKIKCAVIVGDQSTDNDAKRLNQVCKHVRQIETHSSCHLNAEQISAILPEVIVEGTKLLFIENVGNLICPSAFDLGENFKIALLSTAEGEDKPVKYPVLFSDAKITVITKTDLIPHLDWDIKKCRQYIRQINPGVFVFELSTKTGEGMNQWIEYLINLIN